MPRTGRPSEGRTKYVMVRLTPEEHAAIMDDVREHGGTASDVGRAGIKVMLNLRAAQRMDIK